MRVGEDVGRDANRIPSSWAGPLGGVKLRREERHARPRLSHTLAILHNSHALLRNTKKIIGSHGTPIALHQGSLVSCGKAYANHPSFAS
jgi:hypothetical protein